MSFPINEDAYGFVSDEMSLWPCFPEHEEIDLTLIHADMMTVKLLNDRSIGTSQTAFGVTQNESQVLRLATRLGYCCACGRFAGSQFDALKDEIIGLGREMSSKYFDSSMAEAVRFVAHEPEFIKGQRVW
ncbi:hypothetical protein [Photorhabdus asymbiotica]|uniref:hypothetical protein n=2 Tax=Photorhabdus TaxID=29487 RepID=UPI003DA75803